MVLFCLISQLSVFGQQPDTAIKNQDNLHFKSDSSKAHQSILGEDSQNDEVKINFPTYFNLLSSDFKQQLTKPFHLNRKDWRNLGIFAVVAGSLSFADEPIQKYALDLRTKHHGMLKLSRFVTNTGGPYEAITLGLLGGYGWVFKNEKMKTTALLGSQAFITAGVLQQLIKGITGRQRPITYNPSDGETEPKFEGPFHKTFRDASGKKIGSSFPSGHTASAFSVATVFAMEYKDRPWVKFISYGSATLIGLSRITENKHWATDVLAGAALGILCGRQVVNNYHHYARIENSKTKKGTVSFKLNYEFGVIIPGIVYTFR